MADSKKNSSQFWRTFVWTVCYILGMWGILRGLFNFNMFSVAHWAKMSYVELHGFPGFVFGILILAAIPLYIATSVFTYRNKTMPVKIPLPKCLTEAPKVKVPEPPKPVVVEQEPLVDLPNGVPAEMREIFMRARKNYGVRQMSVFNRPSKFDGSPIAATNKIVQEPVPVAADVQSAPTAEQHTSGGTTVSATESGFPIPDDFDTPPPQSFDVPVFSDISFDDDDNSDADVADNNSENNKEYMPLQNVISGAGYKTEIVGNLIIVNNFAIAVHNDDDFWVADELDWFAAGRQKPSPILELKNIAQEQGLTPVLYLGENNIMEFERVSQDWRDAGINIVTDTEELLKMIQPKS